MNETDSLKQAVRYITDEIYTTEVAKILSFDSKSCSASVQLLVGRVYYNSQVELEPMVLHQVPVRYPQMGDFVFYAPLKKDDTVYLHFSRQDWDNWLISKQKVITVEADSLGKHSHNCPYIEVGARNLSNPAADSRFLDKMHMVQGKQYITMDNSEGINIQAGGLTTVNIKPNGEVTITASEVSMSGDLKVSGTITSDTDVVAAGISLVNHVHPYTDNGTPRLTGVPQ